MNESSLHEKYESFLSDQTHLKASTLKAMRQTFRSYPADPERLDAAWFRKRMKSVTPATIKKELIYAKQLYTFLGIDTSELKSLKLPRLEESVTVEDLYTKEELEKILRAAGNTRDHAIFQVLYESACRASEFLSMRFENMSFNEDGTASITVSGKTGTREIPIFESVPALRAWLDVHPVGKGPVWVDTKFPYPALAYHGLYQVASRTIERAAFKREKTRYLHMFRHTRATELVRKGVHGQSLSKFMGWTKKSNMEAVYVHLSTQDVNNEMRSKIFGLDTEEREPRPLLESLKCPKCGTQNTQGAFVCSKCNMPLSNDMIVNTIQRKDEQDQELGDLRQRVRIMEETMKEMLSLLQESKK